MKKIRILTLSFGMVLAGVSPIAAFSDNSLDHYTMSHSLNSIVTSGEKIIIKFYVSIFPGMPLIERTCSLTV